MGDVNHEPTMEEILASIKKIIAEDGDASEAPDPVLREKRPPTEAAADTTEDSVLELTDSVADEPDVPAESPAEPADAGPSDALASDTTIAAGAAAFASLSSIAGGNADGLTDASPAMEAMVREMLQPMLREWIDTNLPEMVEKMVAQEIARIVAERS